MTLPTEPIGSIPRSPELQAGMQAAAAGTITPEQLEALYDDAVRDTLRRFEATGSPVVTDGEQRKQSFATYPVAGLTSLTGGGVTIPFADGHTRQLPVLTAAPFRYATQAWSYLDAARGMTTARMKQAVISASAISLMYPAAGIDGYPREAFIEDLVAEAAAEIRGCLSRGATVQIDFTEARLSLAARPVEGAARVVRRPQQPRPGGAHRRGTRPSRRPLVSGWRPGFDPQRRHRLRRAAAFAVPDERGHGSSCSSPASWIACGCSRSSARMRPAAVGSSWA